MGVIDSEESNSDSNDAQNNDTNGFDEEIMDTSYGQSNAALEHNDSDTSQLSSENEENDEQKSIDSEADVDDDDDEDAKPEPSRTKRSILNVDSNIELVRSTRRNRQKVYTDELMYDSGSDNENNHVSQSQRELDEGLGQVMDAAVLKGFKKSGLPFLQASDCSKLGKNLSKCRECKWTLEAEISATYCRFYKYRKLRFENAGTLTVAGFCHPDKEATAEDINLWLPDDSRPPIDLDMHRSRFILAQVGDQFCDLLAQERNARLLDRRSGDIWAAWKRIIIGVREMCDVCETTLFNFHWSCGKCGFVVCLDCYRDRKNGSQKIWGLINTKERDEFSWLLCTNMMPHDMPVLVMTQIIPGNAMETLNLLMHQIRVLWAIPSHCRCALDQKLRSELANDSRKEIIMEMMIDEQNRNSNNVKTNVRDEKFCRLWFDDITEKNNRNQLEHETSMSRDEKKINCKEDETSEPAPIDQVREEPEKVKSAAEPETKSEPQPDQQSAECEDKMHEAEQVSDGKTKKEAEEESDVKMKQEEPEDKSDDDDDFEWLANTLKRSADDPLFAPKSAKKTITKEDMQALFERPATKSSNFVDPLANAVTGGTNRYLPIRIMTSHSFDIYPNTPHSWLCEGKLLRLEDPLCEHNVRIFQEQWKRGQPVLVSNLPTCIDMSLWRPEQFSLDFGAQNNDLINCITGNLVPNQPMKLFWDGFDDVERRLKDHLGNPMLLKLKDWPPGEDFAEIMPKRFENLMNGLPLPDYTQRTGKFNLASRLPDCFVKPDLGPKMYNAYGSAVYPNKGTTNLHLDISDAVNLMVYVGLPKDKTSEEHMRLAYRAVDEAGCDILTRRRVRENNELPGALWHIYAPRDADKIRDLLNKVTIERGERIEPNHDPIHDQVWYLDGTLRARLYDEYMVEGYAIAQCLGDAVFIPAGAPHQVRNLHNCIKVAEDFVSPENVVHCFHLTQEFRNLSDTHSNHEDKLQIKNIIYHAIKDSVSCLSHLLKKQTEEQKGGSPAPNGSSAEGAV